MRTHHFLQAHNICANCPDGIPQLGQNKASVKGGEPFVSINGEHIE
ncbi:hypothetical protein [Citrobacter pasteurii]|nr:hypothetical protein SF123566_10438 [Shigella flexneri 1235-66]CEJ63641.1 hypothetical protein [Citrobacter pasteurii]